MLFRSSIAFGGKSIWGTLIDAACERYGWSYQYVLWGISYSNPSGTAITLAEEIVENIDRKTAWKEDTTDKQYLRVDHIRRGEVPGIHTIRYDSDADLITITHDAHSRKGFALGAVLAAEYTKDHQGLLTISDMFKF